MKRLIVELPGQVVGEITHENEVSKFSFSEEYIDLPMRPVLGQTFEDGLTRTYSASSALPTWFSNLLPEGQLRDLIAESVGVSPTREFFLLGKIGEDLPGAVRVYPAGEDDLSNEDDASVREGPEANDESEFALKFSLAGLQMKFSVLKTGRGVTLPLHGEGGNTIAKFPDSRFPMVPENEWSMMHWARASGIQVPETDLIESTSISGLPSEFHAVSGKVFIISRFDRDGERRIHIEDFAQVLDRRPTSKEKYSGANYETLANIILNIGGFGDLEEFVRRIVAMVAMGNGDAHLKNFSLIYPDGVHAKLSPAYDLVSTTAYVANDSLALNFAGSKQFSDVTLESFRKLSRRLNLTSDTDLDPVVDEIVSALRDNWKAFGGDLPASEDVRKGIDSRLAQLPIFS